MSCAICCENYNRSSRKCISCLFCKFEACSSCCQTYITNERVSRCMNPTKNEKGELVCGKEWARKFLVDQFPKVFMTKKWKETLEQVGYEREKALLPATQGIVEQELEKERIKNEIDELDKLLSELYKRRSCLTREYHNGGSVRQAAERNFIRACPDEKCRGYLSNVWKCGLCSQWTCSNCHQIKGTSQNEEHVCDPNDVETAKLISKDTKPCPKCSTGIFKIEGCDQMWCTQCHTAFSWKTGRIETNIHNPHFYEWQRRQNNGEAPRVVGDFVCGRELHHRTTREIRTMYNSLVKNVIDDIWTRDDLVDLNDEAKESVRKECKSILESIDLVVESCLHLTHVQMPTYRVDHVQDNLKLRVDFLRKRIDESTFKTLVQRANKNHDKKREIGEILHLFTQTVTDSIFRLMELMRTRSRCKNIDEILSLNKQILQIGIDEPNGILKYCNECLETVAQCYGSKVKQLKCYERILNIRERWANGQRGARDVLR